MQTEKRIYRVKRDISDIIDVIPPEARDEVKEIPIEKVLSEILHKIINQKEDDVKEYESE